jgi:hypothetical protein
VRCVPSRAANPHVQLRRRGGRRGEACTAAHLPGRRLYARRPSA